MRRRKFLVADLLCGAGGSSTGCARAMDELGLPMELVCVNHWPVAIETHTKNHPKARHYCQDIATVRPHLIVPEGYLDLLMASPSCTHHSVARGGKPTSDQQRSDPWHILTWFTELRVKRAIIENVWEFIQWGPVDVRTGKPIKSRKGEYFRAWVDAIYKLGATSIEWRKLNAADYGDATTRQRFIMFIRFDGKPLAWPMPTHTSMIDGLALYPGIQRWKPAREIIDWGIKGRSIFGRKKPLSEKTLARIYAGAVKFKWPEPFLVILRNHMAGRSIDGPLPAIAANGNHVALAQPIVLANRTNNAAKDPAQSPVPALTTAAGGGIAVAEPVIVTGRRNSVARPVSQDPLPALDTKGGVWLAAPLLLGTGQGAARTIEDPAPTFTTGGAGNAERPGCARPMLVTVAHGNGDEADPNTRRARSVEEPLQTIQAKGNKFAVVEPFILNRHGDNGGVRAHALRDPAPAADCRGAGYLGEPFVLSRQGGGAPRSVEEPTPTQCAKHSHALISPYYSNGSGETCKTVEDPLPTATAKARFGIVMPVTHSDGSNRARDVEADPLPTLTTANRGELAFIAAAFGEREGQAARVHDVEDPAPTLCANGRVQLVEAAATEQGYDILFRMLEPHELAAAMGFNADDIPYEFAGTKTEQVKQIGNAVSVAKMRACVKAMMADAVAKPKAEAAKANARRRA